MVKKNKANPSNHNLPKPLAERLKGIIATPAPQDFDPEDAHFKNTPDNEDSETGDSEDSDAGREHYLSVGESKLRKQQSLPISEDPKYIGNTTSRSEIYNDSNEDEDSYTESEVGDSIDKDDNASEVESDFAGDSSASQKSETDVEEDSYNNAKSSGSNDDKDDDSSEVGSDFADNSSRPQVMEADVDEDSDSGSESSDSDDSRVDTASEVDSDLASDSSMPQVEEEDAELAAELKQAEEEEKALLASLAQKAVSDAAKGQHVKNQLSLWEASLELNIQVHKLATLANSLPQKPVGSHGENSMEETTHLINSASGQLTDAIFNALELREALWPADHPESAAFPVSLKRPREEQPDLDQLWEQISKVNESYKPYCQATIEKWSNRVRVTEGLTGPEKKFKALNQSTLHQIQAVLADTSRLVRRSQLKRTAYTVIGKGEDSKSEDNYDLEIYDDLDFYQQLLKEFIDSRMVNNDLNEMGELRWAALKRDKQRTSKVVDPKASKDRKLRYHVHEKLQSFMAPIHVQTWHPEMVDELYASLFQRQPKVPKSNLSNDGIRIFG